jgi:hypothetical protein
MERLGLLGEENLIPTLTRRPELRWLANEEGARWDVLAELGRIGDRGRLRRRSRGRFRTGPPRSKPVSTFGA